MTNFLYDQPDNISEGYLNVGDGHEIFYRVSGSSRNGIPVLCLHGGPGSGSSGLEHRYFDPDRFRVISFDQRGAGKSYPEGETEHNSPEHLVEDIEKLRLHLGVSEWIVTGGSWGACLALLYAIKYPENISRLLLRALFLGDRKSALYLTERTGAARIQPEYFEQYASAPFIPKDAQNNLTDTYDYILRQANEETRLDAAQRFHVWNKSISHAQISEATISQIKKTPEKSYTLARLYFFYTTHFFVNNNYRDFILGASDILEAISIDLIHGECDWICRVEEAHEFKNRYPHTNLNVILGAGHTMADPLMREAFINTINDWSVS